jgi:hypothetical protein
MDRHKEANVQFAAVVADSHPEYVQIFEQVTR